MKFEAGAGGNGAATVAEAKARGKRLPDGSQRVNVAEASSVSIRIEGVAAALTII